MEAPRKFDLLGVGVSCVNLETASEAILQAVREGHGGYVTVTGVHGIIEARKDPAFRDILNGAFVTTPDGMPTVWSGWWRGHREMDRVYGPDLMLLLMRKTQGTDIRHYFFGGREGIPELLGKKLEERFPGIGVAGGWSPPFRPLSPEEKTWLKGEIVRTGAGIIWVGLSTPKQERFMADFLPLLGGGRILIGVGAAFDFHAGLLSQAPRWMQRSSLEWFYRLCMEPRRLWRRYIEIVPLFLLLCLAQAVREWFDRPWVWLGFWLVAFQALVWFSALPMLLAAAVLHGWNGPALLAVAAAGGVNLILAVLSLAAADARPEESRASAVWLMPLSLISSLAFLYTLLRMVNGG